MNLNPIRLFFYRIDLPSKGARRKFKQTECCIEYWEKPELLEISNLRYTLKNAEKPASLRDLEENTVTFILANYLLVPSSLEKELESCRINASQGSAGFSAPNNF